ncbi:hypothetical protein PABG_05256 [Paracoccidioides brasiliensis Pb03]|nr:hypothetical protein PABG_05256 [Paracoccidioides brasiliensis Pb03]
MMMAQPYPAHQVGMAHHPVMPPGHPMAGGQHPNAAHLAGQAPGAGIVQQLHPGVSGPGGPQATQGAPVMGGMPPGTTGPGGPGPSAHALSHLGPTHGHQMYHPQQMGQNYPNNPQLLQHQQMLRQRQMILQQQQQHNQQQQQQHNQQQQHQHQQQQHNQQHQQAQQLNQQQQAQQQQQQHGGIPVSLPNGTQGLNAAQLAIQANPNMRPFPLHLQHLQAQGHQGQAHTMQHQQQQYLALQLAAHQNQQNQQSAQQRAGPQPQSIHDAQSTPPHPQPGPPSQVNTPQQSQQTNQQQPTPSSQAPSQQGQQPQSQSQNQPQLQQIANSQNQPPQQHTQPHQMTAHEAQLRAQQQSAGSAMMMPQRMANPIKRSAVLRLLTFAEHLSAFSAQSPQPGIEYWSRFVDQFFSPSGVLRQGLWCAEQGAKQFEISTPALARYYYTQFTSGIRHIQMIVENAQEKELPTGSQIVESHKTCFIYFLANDCQVVAHGTLRAHYDINGKIDILDLTTKNHTEYIPRTALQPVSPEQKQSPKVGKGLAKRAQQKQPIGPSVTLPESIVTEHGVPSAVIKFLEVAETISQMQTLFQYSIQCPHLSPPDALRQLVASFNSHPQAIAFNQGHMGPQQTPGQRTPSLNGPTQFSSPAAAHLGLPGSQGSPHLGGPTHTPSPAQNSMVGPIAMVAQQSQQGTNTSGSQGTSANTSPNVSNKRRRSAIKSEGDDTGAIPDVNGTGPIASKAPKASPRVGGKRQKGTS